MAKGSRKGGKGPTLIQRSRQVPAEQKALVHQVLGAGRSRVKRRFLGLTGSEQDQIKQKVTTMISHGLKGDRS